LIRDLVQRDGKRSGVSGALRGVAAAAVLLGLAEAGPVHAEVPEPPAAPSHNLFGMTGLIDMPTADMQPDAQISFTAGYFGGYYRNTLSAQILPWLEQGYCIWERAATR